MADGAGEAADTAGRPEQGGPSAAEAASDTPRIVSLEEIREAAVRLGGVALRTPLLPVRSAPENGRTVWLKCENFQHVSAFKVRGAYNFVARLPEERRRAGLVTFSSGNHAQGVAFAARAFGLDATIVMPEDAPMVKVHGTRRLGASVEQVGTTVTERQERAEEIVRETGATMVPPFDHPHVIAGQGTVGLEIVEQLEAAGAAGKHEAGGAGSGGGRDVGGVRPGLVLVPIGGGGLISGVAAALRAIAPEGRVVGVEPEGAASMRRSLDAGEPVTLERVHTVADGLKPVRPGEHTFLHVRELVEDVVTVSDAEIREGLRWLFRARLVAEPSGAAAPAALLAGRVPAASDGETVAVVSGGNVDPRRYAEWITSSEP